MFWESDSFSGTFPLAILLVRLFSWLPAYRILMVWVYDRTGSLLVTMLMHAVYSASKLIMVPLGLALVLNLIYESVSAIALWIVVAAVYRRQTLPRQARKTLLVKG